MQYFFSNVNLRVESDFLSCGTGQENTGKEIGEGCGTEKKKFHFSLEFVMFVDRRLRN